MLPLTIITGYLGSGKTTLLNRLLTAGTGRRIAVVQNDYGEIAIDHDLVVEVAEPESILTLANGCACCTVRDDMVEALHMLLDHQGFDHIVLETTGLASPGSIIMTLLTHPDAGELFTLDGVVAVADALHLAEQLERGPEAAQQIAYADMILLNKIDSAEEVKIEDAERRIRAINPAAGIIRTSRAMVEPERILEIGGFDAARTAEELRRLGDTGHAHEQGVTSVSVAMEGVLSAGRFEEWLGRLLDDHHGEIYRIKGVLNVEGSDRRYLVNGVHALWNRQYGRAWGEEQRMSRLVLIGRDLDAGVIRTGLEACRAGT